MKETTTEEPLGRPALARLTRAFVDASPKGWIRLNTNESTFAPSSRVIAALTDAATTINRYPDPFGEPLRSQLAAHHGVSEANILVSHGADGILGTCFRAFCEPGCRVVLQDPTYPFLANLAELGAASITRANSPENVFAASKSIDAAITILVNPGNPLGSWLPPDTILAEAPANGIVLIDEAYADFAPESVAAFAASRRNWIVVRTFSKAYGLAGVRLGYAISCAELIARLSLVQDPYPVSTAAVAAGVAALEDVDHYVRNVASVCAERFRLTQGLRGLGWVVDDSFANFVFGKPRCRRTLPQYLRALESARILVRTFASAPDGIRISIGQPEDNDALLRVLGGIAH